MHRFTYRRNALYAESVSVEKIAQSVGTPFYCYSIGTFLDHYLKLRRAFRQLDTTICFSMKANSNLTVLKALVNRGAGLDIVSGGELVRAKKVGVSSKKIVYASVGKTESEIEEAIRSNILMFNVESAAELELINSVACRLDRVQKVAIRINPDVTPGTHHYITTGSKQNKFGLDIETSERLFKGASRFPYLKLAGIHIHIGSQITRPAPFVEAVGKCLDFIDRVGRAGHRIEYLNIGGGLGIIYSDEKPQTAEQFASVIVPLIRRRNPSLKLILEPGRFISGNSGILVTRVIYRKRSPAKSFVIVDAAMNDLIRPSFYGAYHEISPVDRSLRRGKPEPVDIVGPVCESGDFLAKDRRLPPVEPGDLLAVFSCGAYGFVMSSNYNSRPRVPEVVVRGAKFFVSRRRETMDDLLRLERIVPEAVR